MNGIGIVACALAVLTMVPFVAGQQESGSILQRVIAEGINREELVKLGQPAIAELTAGLKTVPSQDAGKVALALGHFGPRAKAAVRTLIELFPQEPQTGVAIRISSMPTAQAAREKLFQELVRKYGAGGEVVAEATGTFQNNTIPNPKSLTYYYNTKVPAAAAALYMIVGEIPGVRQEEWRQWAAKKR